MFNYVYSEEGCIADLVIAFSCKGCPTLRVLSLMDDYDDSRFYY